LRPPALEQQACEGISMQRHSSNPEFPMRVRARSSLLVAVGFIAGAACAFVGFTHAATTPAQPIPSNRAYSVSIDEIKQNFAHAETFTGSYSRTVTMSDGSTHIITLRPEVVDGKEVLELTDQNSNGKIAHSLIGPNATTTNGMLMINVVDATPPKSGGEGKKVGQ
jgi:hypothetical protein